MIGTSTLDLSGVNAIVTGATRGLGLAFAEALINAGASVVINGRSEPACRAATQRLDSSGAVVQYVAGAIEDEATAAALVQRCREAFGPLSFVVNNAGITRDRSLLRMTTEDFDAVIAVHLRGTWLLCRAAAAAMKDSGGAILNLTSGSALYGLVGQSNYAAAKGGVTALTRALSVELERFGIRVNALYPVAATDMTAPVVELTGGADGPLGSAFGDPAEVATIIPYLAGRSAVDITGQVLAFDGTDLTVWSHPEQLTQITHPAPWTTTQLQSAIATVATRLAPLHSDAIGSQARLALGYRDSQSRRSALFQTNDISRKGHSHE